jgi:hypothetical protein
MTTTASALSNRPLLNPIKLEGNNAETKAFVNVSELARRLVPTIRHLFEVRWWLANNRVFIRIRLWKENEHLIHALH